MGRRWAARRPGGGGVRASVSPRSSLCPGRKPHSGRQHPSLTRRCGASRQSLPHSTLRTRPPNLLQEEAPTGKRPSRREPTQAVGRARRAAPSPSPPSRLLCPRDSPGTCPETPNRRPALAQGQEGTRSGRYQDRAAGPAGLALRPPLHRTLLALPALGTTQPLTCRLRPVRGGSHHPSRCCVSPPLPSSPTCQHS